MKTYNVDVTIHETIQVPAFDEETAATSAEDEVVTMFDVDYSQITVGSIKEVL